MGNISKWFDNEISHNVDNIIDSKSLDDVTINASEFYVVTIYNERKVTKLAEQRWTKVWTFELQGHKCYNVYTTFDMALIEYYKKSKAHPKAIMRVERRSLNSLLYGNNYIIKLINVYGDHCYFCDGKKAFPEDYWKRWPHTYAEDAKNIEIEKEKKPIGFVINHEDVVSSKSNKEKDVDTNWKIEDSDAFE